MIIALSGKKRAGKSIVASVLVERGFVMVKFAAPLKDMLRTLGLDEVAIEGGEKEQPSGLLCGKTPRHAMQTLGTEWGRELIGDDIWVNAWKTNAVKHENVIVDDCRFLNEAEAVLSLGGQIWKVTRPGLECRDTHASETAELPYSIELINDGTIEQLKAKVP